MNRSFLAAALLVAALTVGAQRDVTDAGRDAPPFVSSPSAPRAAPNPPYVSLRASGASAVLDWIHPDTTLTSYETWRCEQPYCDPGTGEGVKLGSYAFSEGIYGDFSTFSYIDNGSCGYFVADDQNLACAPQNPPATVIGDADHQYYWIVRACNGEFADSNRVGEFDFLLVRGG